MPNLEANLENENKRTVINYTRLQDLPDEK
jgi:hypothetical protein